MNIVPLLLFIFFGTFILIGYAKLSKNIWNGITGSLKKLYIFMILLSFISGAYLLYFFTVREYENVTLLYLGLCLFLGFSLIWAWAPYYHERIVLLLVAIGSYILLMYVNREYDKSLIDNLAVIACSILFVQTFLFDFAIYTKFIN
jgi:hypothetical protein